MLKILDRYIIRKFLTTFFFMLAVIMVLAMVFDLSDRLTEFIDNEAPLSEIIFTYYFNFILLYGNMFSFFIIFISVIWFTAKMAQETEIIPIWNSGRPFGRFIRPYMIGATILVAISLVVTHLVLPYSNKKRLAFEELYYRDALNVTNYQAEYPGNKIVQFDSYYQEQNVINQFVLQQYNEKGDSLLYSVIARNAVNEIGTNKWKLKEYVERRVGYPKDIIVEGKEKDTTFDFRIDEMAARNTVATAMGYSELKEFIEREKHKGSGNVPFYEIALYERTANPFAAYILTIIGVAVASRKKRGGIGINIAIGLMIVLVYLFAMKIMQVAATNVGFPPYLAVWFPNIMFAIVAAIMYKQVQR